MQVATHATTKAMERPLRRVPVQGRSVARVARMLDACAELVDEVGCDGLTTTMLAERARVAIGSVYQFFPDKQAVIRALILRNLEDYLGRLSNRLAQNVCVDWQEIIDAAIDEYVGMHRDVPGFRTVRVGRSGERGLGEEPDSCGVIAERLLAVLAERFGYLEDPSLVFSVTVAVEVFDALVTMAFRRDSKGDPAILSECGVVTREYLAKRLPLVS